MHRVCVAFILLFLLAISTFAPISQAQATVQVKTDKPVYSVGEPVKVSILISVPGQGADVEYEVTMTIQTPTGVIEAPLGSLNRNQWTELDERSVPQLRGLTSTPGTYKVVVCAQLSVKVCGDTTFRVESGVTPPTTPPFDFTLQISPQTVTVKQGEMAQYLLSVIYSDPAHMGTAINVQVTGLGPGMDYALDRTGLLSIVTSYTPPDKYGPITPPGTYTLTITGSAQGVMRQVTVTVLVEERPPVFDFTITVSPSTQTIEIGQTVLAYTITVNLVSPPVQLVTLTVSGLPNDLIGTLSTNSANPPFTSELTIDASTTQARGTYRLDIIGSGGGIMKKTSATLIIQEKAEFSLTVSPTKDTVMQGEKAVFKIQVKATSTFKDTVTLGISEAPSDINFTFSPASGKPPFTSNLTMDTFVFALVGNHTITIQGSGGGLTNFVTVHLVIEKRSIGKPGTEPMIVDVEYPRNVKMGDTIKLTGRVVKVKDNISNPIPGWKVNITLDYPPASTTTDSNGAFSASIRVPNCGTFPVEIHAFDPKLPPFWGGFYADYFDLIEADADADVKVQLEKSDYKTVESVNGSVRVRPRPESASLNWAEGLIPLVQIRGPKGGDEKVYNVEMPDYTDPMWRFGKHDFRGFNEIYDRPDILFYFRWKIPEYAEEGTYEVHATITGTYIDVAEGKASFTLDKTVPAKVYADYQGPEVRPGPSVSGFIVGDYTTFENAPISDANVTVVATDENRTKTARLQGVTDKNGTFSISIEELNLIGGAEWILWEVVVSASKEGYSTGTDIVYVRTPTLREKVEIVDFSPPLSYLNEQVSSGKVEFDTGTGFPFDIRLRVRYTVLSEGYTLNVRTGSTRLGGRWSWSIPATHLEKRSDNSYDCDTAKWIMDVSINGGEKPEWPLANLSRTYGWERWVSIPMPICNASIPLAKGVDREIEVSISGTLFNFKQLRESGCGGIVRVPYPGEPKTAPPSLDGKPLVGGPNVELELCKRDKRPGRTGIAYPLAALPGISARADAWVGSDEKPIKIKHRDKDIELKAHGVLRAQILASGIALRNREVNLEPVESDSSGKSRSTGLLSVKSVAKTDDEGWIVIPLKLTKEMKEIQSAGLSLGINISATGFSGEANVGVQLRPPPDVELKIKDFHLLQVTEIGKPYDLVSMKPAAVRAYLEAADTANKPLQYPFDVDVRLFVLVGGNILTAQRKTVTIKPDSPNTIEEAEADQPAKPTAAQAGAQANWKKVIPVDFYFTPVTSGTAWPMEIEIKADPDDYFKPSKDKTLTIEGTVKQMKRVELIFVPVNIDNLDIKFVMEQVAKLKEFYPLSEGDVGFGIRKTLRLIGDWSFTGLIKKLNDDYGGSSSDSGTEWRVIGVLDDKTWVDSANKLWWGKQDALVAKGLHLTPTLYWVFGKSMLTPLVLLRYPNFEYTLSHELGHSLGRLNLWKEQYDPNIPTFGEEIHGYILKDGGIFFIPKNWNDKQYTAWKRAFGVEKYLEKQIVEVYDFMGNPQTGGAHRPWTWNATYKKLFDALKDPPSDAVLWIEGCTYQNNTAVLEPAWMMSGIVESKFEEGDYEAQLVTSSGKILYSLKFGEAGIDLPFSFNVLFSPGAASIRILKGEEILAERRRSANAPTVQVSQPKTDAAGRIVDLQWSAEDPDNDTITYRIFYSHDGGGSWMPIASGLKETSYSMNLSYTPGGGDCKVKVMASDGFNTGYAVSDTFATSRKLPLATILTVNTTFQEGEPAVLEAVAYDFEDGLLPGESLRWFSDKDGFLGNGSHIERMLSPGEHVITLEATDSTGENAKDMITLKIEKSDQLTDIIDKIVSNLPVIAVAAVVVVTALVVYKRRVRRPTEAPKEVEMKHCINCGARIRTDAQFCGKCGSSQE